jgi:hypothetical protein
MATPTHSDAVNPSPASPEQSHPQHRKRIAVIAVHGVSDQAPNSTARAIADLLLRDGSSQDGNSQDGTPSQTYQNFRETGLRIPVTPTQVNTPNPFGSKDKRIKPRKNKPLDLNERGEWLTYLLDSNQAIAPRPMSHPQTSMEPLPYLQPPMEQNQTLPNDAAHLFTVDQLRDCNSQEIYESIRIEGVRAASLPASSAPPQAGSALDIHIYELFWADLSRLGSGVLQIFGSLYQLLFHLVSLGRQTVDMARIDNQTYAVPSPKLWDYYGLCQKWAGRFLSLLIPLLNLYVLVAALLFLPMRLPQEQRSLLGFALPVLLLIVLAGLLVWTKMKHLPRRLMPLIPMGLACVTVVGLYYCRGNGFLWRWFGNAQWMTILWAIFLCSLFWWLLIRSYNHHRPGTNDAFLIIGVFFFLALFFLLFSPADLGLTGLHAAIARAGNPSTAATKALDITAIATVSLRLVELLYGALFLCWLFFLLLYGLTYSLGMVLIGAFLYHHRQHRGNRDQQSQIKARLDRFKRTAWTARFTLSLPAILFSILTLSLWTAFQRIGSTLLPPENYHSLLFMQEENMGILSFQDFTKKLTVFSGSPFAAGVMVCLLMALFLMLWGITPSALAEVTPPQPPPRTPHGPKPPVGESFEQVAFRVATDAAEEFGIDLNPEINPVEQSQKFGHWLTHGFGLQLRLGEWRFFWVLGEWIISVVIPLIMVVGTGLGLYQLAWGQDIFTTSDNTASLLDLIAGLLTASATSLIAFRKQLEKLSLGLRGILDVVLDVDNYLRLHPRTTNPRGKIFARYTSLLRYLCQWQDPQNGQGYDGLVIVAHSQGTVISADLLRFLQTESDPTLAKLGTALPIELLTLGSPLKQLYGFAFPNRYHWLVDQPSPRVHWQLPNTPIPTGAVSQSQSPPPLSPDPATLGVRGWVNAYRSGDYVGRVLWGDPNNSQSWYPAQQSTMIQDPAGKVYGDRREFCIGAGAHTHYWDATAPMVAQEIDRMIASFQ